ncbi:uncharacterized protein M6B38_382775 [Iris pallida]|uniref:Reverse transcriptase zinc-binding domain-containing protein n=1 Tax=Iris pallida TaxID=29817 RepID=A0AAX6G6G7_IRIPA|nr:uncharacterized protein M6B38_382775 [Iris pallida]
MRIPGAGPGQVRGADQGYSVSVVATTWFGPTMTRLRRWTSFGKGVARKMQLCAYRLLRGRLMTRDRLLRFGMQIPDAKCVLCNDEDESMGHLFFVCPVTWHIWTEQCAQLRGGVGMDRDIRSILSWIRDHRGRDPGGLKSQSSSCCVCLAHLEGAEQTYL